jgi:hypothetical protein
MPGTAAEIQEIAIMEGAVEIVGIVGTAGTE